MAKLISVGEVVVVKLGTGPIQSGELVLVKNNPSRDGQDYIDVCSLSNGGLDTYYSVEARNIEVPVREALVTKLEALVTEVNKKIVEKRCSIKSLTEVNKLYAQYPTDEAIIEGEVTKIYNQGGDPEEVKKKVQELLMILKETVS